MVEDAFGWEVVLGTGVVVSGWREDVVGDDVVDDDVVDLLEVDDI